MRRFCVFASVVLVGLSTSSADDTREAHKTEASRVLNGVLKERKGLTAGVFEVTGTSKIRRSQSPEVNSTVTSHYAFDRSKSCLRYDNEESHYRVVVDARAGLEGARQLIDLQAGNIRLLKLKHVRNQAYSASWQASGENVVSHITLVAPDAKTDSFSESHHMFDVRAAGLMGFEEWTRCKSVEEILQWLQTLQIDDVSQSKTAAILKLSDKTFKVDATIETENGFRPANFRVRSSNPAETQVEARMTAKWARRDGVDVPIELVYTDDIPDLDHHTEYRLKLDWKSVNQAIDPGEFEYTAFRGLPPGGRVSVIDGRDRRRPIHIGDWIEDGVVKKP